MNEHFNVFFRANQYVWMVSITKYVWIIRIISGVSPYHLRLLQKIHADVKLLM